MANVQRRTRVAPAEALVAVFKRRRKLFELFLKSVSAEFESERSLNTGTPPVVHSLRSRMKDDDHLLNKIGRKRAEGRFLSCDNVLQEITDCAGLRVLHLHQNQFSAVHSFIQKKVKAKHWKLLEQPIAYTWDPESVDYFKKFKIRTALKSSYYTSVHYIIAPANEQDGICCEVQVRTLFEEVWGEIDHSINYPDATLNIANIEQLRVLSKLVSTGSRLADAIFKVHALG